jgi:hypothetical protein
MLSSATLLAWRWRTKPSDRRGDALRPTAKVRQLSRAQPGRAAIRPWAGLSRQDHQAGPRPRPGHVGRSGLGGGARSGSVARVLPSRASTTRPTCRRRRNRPEARRDHLAFTEQRRKLCLEQALIARQEAARSRAEGRSQVRAGTKRRGPCLQYQEPSRSGAPMGRASRDGLRPLRRRLESARSEAGAHRRRKRGTTMKAARQGSRLTPCSSPRGRPCARGK